MTEAELLARMGARDSAAAGPAAGKGKPEERSGAVGTGMTKFLSTFTGGGADYLDLLVRRMKGEEVAGGVDELRKSYEKDYKANPTSALIGGVTGSAAQMLPVGKAMQVGGLLSKAPGIIGGMKSGAQLGTGIGVANEAIHQLDRLGSTKTAKEEFSVPASAFRIGKETIAGTAGGALGGVVGNLADKGKGMIANLAKEPLDDAVIRAATREADEAAKLGVAGTGKLGPEEALRAIKDPALRSGAADTAAALEGRMAQAGERYSGGQLPREEVRDQFRTALRKDVGREAADATSLAGTASADAAKAQAALAESRELMRSKPLDVASGSYWAVQGDPQLKAITKQLLEADRGRFAGKMTSDPHGYNKAEAAKLAAARYPSNTVGGVERAMAHDPSVAASADKVLRMQNPAFQTADDAVAAMTKAQAEAAGKQARHTGIEDIVPSMGRQNALKPNDPGGPGFTLSPTRIALQLAKIGHDKAAGTAIKKSTDRMLDDPLEDVLRQIGKRTGKQQKTERLSYPILHYMLSNSGFIP